MLVVTLRLKIEELEGTLDATRKQRTKAIPYFNSTCK